MPFRADAQTLYTLINLPISVSSDTRETDVRLAKEASQLPTRPLPQLPIRLKSPDISGPGPKYGMHLS
jgi:hypothetical protein